MWNKIKIILTRWDIAGWKACCKCASPEELRVILGEINLLEQKLSDLENS